MTYFFNMKEFHSEILKNTSTINKQKEITGTPYISFKRNSHVSAIHFTLKLIALCVLFSIGSDYKWGIKDKTSPNWFENFKRKTSKQVNK